MPPSVLFERGATVVVLGFEFPEPVRVNGRRKACHPGQDGDHNM